MTTSMTSREFLTAVISILSDGDTSKSAEVLTYAETRLAKAEADLEKARTKRAEGVISDAEAAKRAAKAEAAASETQSLIDVLSAATEPMTGKELAEATGLKATVVPSRLKTAVADGKVVKEMVKTTTASGKAGKCVAYKLA